MKGNFIETILLLIVFSCSVLPQVDEKQVTLENTSWEMDYQYSGSKTITLVIEDSKIFGNTGCNDYFAEYAIPKIGSLVIGNIGSTKKACDTFSSEDTFFSILNKVNRYVLQDNILVLYQDELLLMKFHRKK